MSKFRIVIAGTFTAEPVEEALTFWISQFGIDGEIEFAPYHQIHQQLLDPASLMARNKDGLNILLIRFEDWPTPADIANDLVDAVRLAAGRSSAPYLILFCPPSPLLDSGRNSHVQLAELRMVTQLTGVSGVYMVASADLERLYPEAAEHDARGEVLGRIPYTSTAFAGLATMIARNIHALMFPPYKVIALDCDQTLWKGVCGEDGPYGVMVDRDCAYLQRFALAKREAGLLLCMCSKNEEDDVVQVFDAQPEMPLRQSDFTANKINWLRKSQNIRALASELSLGMDSFIFLDDNPIECNEVRSACPDVVTLQLPGEGIPEFLNRVWAFDTRSATEVDRQRTELYRQNAQRTALMRSAPNLRGFLDSLGLEISISPIRSAQLARVSQLTRRTNQFNSTTIRRSEAEITELCGPGGHRCLTVEVKDRFGDYGLVGVILFAVRGDALAVDSFLLSCRALGRGVEHRMLLQLAEIARAHHLSHIDVAFTPTAKNLPVRKFLRIGEELCESVGEGSLYRFPIQLALNVGYDPDAEDRSGACASPATDGDAMRAAQAVPSSPAFSSLTAAERAGLLLKIAERLHSAPQVIAAVEAARLPLPAKGSEPVGGAAPLNGTEERLCQIWAAQLRKQSVGAEEDFFVSGGDSLGAMSVVLDIDKAFGCEITPADLMRAPTPRKLAPRILSSFHSPDRIEAIRLRPGSRGAPVFWVPGGCGLSSVGFRAISALLDDRPVYGLVASNSQACAGLTLEEKAAKYILAARQVIREGPYHLFGYCVGSWLAYEMACQLIMAGKPVGATVIGDMPVEGHLSRLSGTYAFMRAFAYHGMIAIRLSGPARREYLDDTVKRFYRDLLKFRRWQQTPLEQLTTFDRTEMQARTAATAYIQSFRSLDHSPDLDVILTSVSPWSGLGSRFDGRRGWSKFSSQTRFHVVQGTHLGVLEFPQNVAFAGTLVQILQHAEGRGPIVETDQEGTAAEVDYVDARGTKRF